MTETEIQMFEMERAETMRAFDVTLRHGDGAEKVTRIHAHFHTVDDDGHLSMVTFQNDGSRCIRHLFHADRWLQLEEVGTSAKNAPKLVTH